jgi:hypothetical protein
VSPLSDEDRLTLVRWIDLGCPLDLDFDPKKPERRGFGWMADETRPTLTLTYPRPGRNEPLSAIVLGIHDFDSGVDIASLDVRASLPLQGRKAGENLANLFEAGRAGAWRLALDAPIDNLAEGVIKVQVRDRAGNLTRLDRVFSVSPQSLPTTK